MAEAYASDTVREAVAAFDTQKEMEDAIDELESSGFDRADIAMLANAETVDEKLGHHYRKVRDLEDNPDVPTTAYVPRESIGEGEGALIGALTYVGAVAALGAVVASGGAVAAVITAAAIGGGTGGLIGSVLATLLGEHHAKTLADQLDKGGILVWVRTRDAEHEKRAVAILDKHSAHDVHVHSLPVVRHPARPS